MGPVIATLVRIGTFGTAVEGARYLYNTVLKVTKAHAPNAHVVVSGLGDSAADIIDPLGLFTQKRTARTVNGPAEIRADAGRKLRALADVADSQGMHAKASHLRRAAKNPPKDARSLLAQNGKHAHASLAADIVDAVNRSDEPNLSAFGHRLKHGQKSAYGGRVVSGKKKACCAACASGKKCAGGSCGIPKRGGFQDIPTHLLYGPSKPVSGGEDEGIGLPGSATFDAPGMSLSEMGDEFDDGFEDDFDTTEIERLMPDCPTGTCWKG
jgi:hypothetical protein